MEDYQISEFLKAIDGHVHEYLYKITMVTGMREVEVLGLTWDCINFERGTLIIRRQLVRDRQKGGEYHFSTPKNGKMRVIVLAPSVIELFKAQQTRQALMMLDAGKKWAEAILKSAATASRIWSCRTHRRSASGASGTCAG